MTLPILPKSSMPFSRSAACYKAFHGDRPTRQIAKLVHEINGRGGRLIEFGAGLGAYKADFEAVGFEYVGVEPCPEMRAAARRDGVELQGGDLRGTWHGKADVVACLFGAFSYATAGGFLTPCLWNAGRHLRPGGLLFFDFVHALGPAQPNSERREAQTDAGKIVRMAKRQFDAHSATWLIDFTFAPAGWGEPWTERHEMRAFTAPEIIAAMTGAGMSDVQVFPFPNRPDGRLQPADEWGIACGRRS